MVGGAQDWDLVTNHGAENRKSQRMGAIRERGWLITKETTREYRQWRRWSCAPNQLVTVG